MRYARGEGRHEFSGTDATHESQNAQALAPEFTNILGIFLGFVLVVPPINRQLMAIISHRFWRSHTSFDILASICFVAVVTASTWSTSLSISS